MKVVIVPDSFKGSLSAEEVAISLQKGILFALPKTEVVLLPIADGGEGTMSVLLNNANGKKYEATVHDPLFREIKAEYVILENGECVFEIAETSGLNLLLKEERNPFKTTTIGMGELLLAAFNSGRRNFLLGLGGSATNDCGLGILHAFGFRFLDGDGNELSPTGESLIRIKQISDEYIIEGVETMQICLAVDVTNPLYGEQGAAYVFAEQKGASKDEIKLLDEGLRNFYSVVSDFLNKDIDSDTDGFGAAGGIAFALTSFFNAKIVSGIDLISKRVDLEKCIKEADLVISGEGKIDRQSLHGKVISGVEKLTSKCGKPLVLVGGEVELSTKELNNLGITAAFSISNKPLSLEKAMDKETAQNNLEFLGGQIISLAMLSME